MSALLESFPACLVVPLAGFEPEMNLLCFADFEMVSLLQWIWFYCDVGLLYVGVGRAWLLGVWSHLKVKSQRLRHSWAAWRTGRLLSSQATFKAW